MAVTPREFEPGRNHHIVAAAGYCRAKVGSSHLYAHPDNSTLYARKIYSTPLYTCRVVLLLLRQRRGAANNALGTTIKYLR
jgi:hypothetical protein